MIDYDTIIVMGGGKMLESGPPSELLSREGGELRSMAEALGSEGHATLVERAAACATSVDSGVGSVN